MSGKDRIRLVIADDTPVDRAVVRFFLEGHGFSVVGETTSPEELARMAAHVRPDAIVLGDTLGGVDSMAALGRIRDAAPDTKVVVLSTEPPKETPATPAGADAYLEKGVGLQALATVLAELCGRPAPAALAAATRTETEPIRFPQKTVSARLKEAKREAPRAEPPRWRRRGLPVLLAAVATISVLIVLLRNLPPVEPEPTTPERAGETELVPETSQEAVSRLLTAQVTLAALSVFLESGDYDRAIEFARDLLLQRQAALLAGADLADFDAAVSALAPIIAGLDPQTALALLAILDPLLPPISIGPIEPTTGQTPAGIGSGLLTTIGGEITATTTTTTTTTGGGGDGNGGGGGDGGGNGGGGDGGDGGGGDGGAKDGGGGGDGDGGGNGGATGGGGGAGQAEEADGKKGKGHEECAGEGHVKGRGEGHDGDDCEESSGEGSEPPDEPGQSEDAPGNGGDSPGQSEDAPGKGGDSPGKSEDAPGNDGGGPSSSSNSSASHGPRRATRRRRFRPTPPSPAADRALEELIG